MSFYKLNYHIVFATKFRSPAIYPEIERQVYTLLYNLLKQHKCFVHRIGGMLDHVHILAEIPQTVYLPDFIKDLKTKSSYIIKHRGICPYWPGWQEGYGIFAVSFGNLETVKNYIVNQKEHHKKVTFIDEYRKILIEEGFDPESPYFPKKS